MELKKELNGENLNIALEGRLDTATSPSLEAELKSSLAGVTALNFDFEKLEYISSAGLRVLLSAQKTMSAQGKMTLTNVRPEVKEIFDITGFSDFLTIL